MINLTKRNIGLVSLFFLLAIISCSKMDATYKGFLKNGEIRYSARPDSIQIFAGHNRIKISWLLVSAPNVSSGRVYWNNGTDSVQIPVKQAAANDSNWVNVVIDNLSEGLYTFEIYNYDHQGNPSIKSDTIGQVYGNIYINSLLNRPIKSAVLINGKPRITWDEEPDSQALSVELKYSDVNGEVHQQNVQLNEFETRIGSAVVGDSIQYRTLFMPEPNSIDTFYSHYETIKLLDAAPIELDKEKFKELILPTDALKSILSYVVMPNLWDGDLKGNSWYRTINGAGSPHWYSFDLGVEAKLSSYKIWQRGVISEHSLVYTNANPHLWEVWGSRAPNPDGSWDGWTKLLDCESTKPSGLPLGQTTDEDIAFALKGEAFTFSQTSPPVRYIRIKVLETWNPANSDHSFIQELTFYGIPY